MTIPRDKSPKRSTATARHPVHVATASPTTNPLRFERHFERHYTVSSTCYSQGTITASRQHVYLGEVAQNTLPFGTRIILDHAVFGRRVFTVEDRIGSASQLDFYNPSEAVCVQYGRRTIGFRVAHASYVALR